MFFSTTPQDLIDGGLWNEETRQQLMAAAAESPVVTGLRVSGLPAAPQLRLVIDREKANTFGVQFAAINAALSANLGSAYVNDFLFSCGVIHREVFSSEFLRVQCSLPNCDSSFKLI